ncbi:MAG: hypothetical protein ACI4ED_04200 [Suilimivivens sp.]
MKFPIFASFIIFCLWLSYEIHKHKKQEKESSEAFWETERKANSTRRKSLDDLNYITIPFDTLPMDALKDDPSVKEYHETLHTISEEPIVNFTGISNTDLKLKYGAPNIDLLMLYDQRYTTLARTLQSWAKSLYDNGLVQEAKTVLEFAMETGTDVSASYKLLAGIYKENGEVDKIAKLIPVAESLNSALSSHIAAFLEEMIK